MKLNELDFSAFNEKFVETRYNGKLPGLPKMLSPFISAIILSIFLSLLLIPAFASLSSLTNTSLGVLIVITGIFISMYKLTSQGKSNTVRAALFANRNKFGYSYKGGKFKQLEGLGSVLGEPMQSNVVSGHFMGQKFMFCSTYGSGFFTIMTVDLPNEYPHILLDAKSNNFVKSNILNNFPNSQEISLEGNFPEYFSVNTSTSPVETLQILSPELMGRMIDYTHKADIEIIRDRLFLVCNYKTLEEPVVKMFFEAVEQILKDIGVTSNNSRVDFTAIGEADAAHP